MALHPRDFEVNEAWIVFQINKAPVRTTRDGEFNCIALMDAASLFILASAFAPVGEGGLSKAVVGELFKQAMAHKNQLPKKLFVPPRQHKGVLLEEAERLNLAVVRMTESKLAVFTREARASFRQRFG